MFFECFFNNFESVSGQTGLILQNKEVLFNNLTISSRQIDCADMLKVNKVYNFD